jgi:DNA-binding NarL/FixJ family response regulator
MSVSLKTPLRVKKTRILLADDHAIVIEGLRRLLDRPKFEIVGTVSNGHELLKAAANLRPDLVVVDVAMPLLNGIEAARKVRETNPRSKFVFLTMHSEPVYAREALAAGGLGYVLKSSAGDELLDAIRDALKGRVYVTKSIAAQIRTADQGIPGSRRNRKAGERIRLTPRQREVVQLLCEGRQVKEISALIKVSSKTVEFHKYQAMSALGVRTVAELTRYAVQQGIVA